VRNFLKIAAIATLAVALVFSFGVSKSSKTSDRAWLGVLLQTVDDDMADAFDLPVEKGAIVNEVLDDSPAEEAGLREDDIVIELNGQKITDSGDLVDLIHDSKPGDEVTLVVVRDDGQHKLTATLVGRPRGHSPDKAYTYRHPDYFSPHHVPRAPKAPKAPRAPKIKDLYYYNAQGGAFLGVMLSDLSRQLGDYFGVEKGRGALVTEVSSDTPAEKAGILAGDVIVSIDGEKVYDAHDAKEVVREMEPGDEVEVVVLRDKKELTLKAELDEAEHWISDEFEFDFDFDHDIDHRLHRSFSVPDLDLYIPYMRGLTLGDFDDLEEWYDSDEMKEEMEDLYEELEDMRLELRQMKGEKNEEFQEELDKLRDDLKDLRKKLD